jgi:hypothetical protein
MLNEMSESRRAMSEALSFVLLLLRADATTQKKEADATLHPLLLRLCATRSVIV